MHKRFFRTHNTGLVHSLPGAALSDVLERRAHDSVKDACISLKEFERILHVYLLDYYAQAYHEGIRGIPAKKWEEAVQSGYRPYLPHSAQDVYMILLPSEERLLGRQGIRFQNLLYQSVDLAQLRSELPADKLKVRIKYDLADLGSVFVQNPLVPGVYMKVPCTEPAYALGLSAWKHRVICDRARKDRKTVDIPALARAKENIQNEVENAYSRSRRIRTRKRAARLKEFAAQGASQAPRPEPEPEIAVTPPVERASPTDASQARTVDARSIELPGFGADFKLPRR